jgi:branched-chain amino acid transport system substrate-binding protein
MLKNAIACLVCAVTGSGALAADITVCVNVSSTGSAAAQGIPQERSVSLIPTSISEHVIRYFKYDDATDPTQAVRNIRKCFEEHGADAIVGSTVTPTSIAIANIAGELKIPLVSLAPIPASGEVDKWTFRSPHHVDRMADAILEHMAAKKVKTLGFIGYADSYGDQWLAALKDKLAQHAIKLEAIERFARSDTSVTAQALKLVAVNPDAVLVVAGGTPAALPNLALSDRGYRGRIYHTHGSAGPDFLRVAGRSAEGTILPVGPIVVAEQLPDDHPSKAVALKYKADYELANGAGKMSSNGAYMFDAGLRLVAALTEAIKVEKPGTPEFRSVLRDKLEMQEGVVGAQGVYFTSPTDHYGHDKRSAVMVVVEDGKWKYIESEGR